MEIGLGPNEYDCSGFIISAISLVVGREANGWRSDLRHIRQMYATGHELLQFQPRIGDILILGRSYDFDCGKKLVPAHGGVITESGRAELAFLHAQASIGRVIRNRLASDSPDRLGKVMGVIRPEQL